MKDLSECLREGGKPFFRCCALCLMEIVRSDYNEHMSNVHGYELLNLGFLNPVQKK